jgi:hypothetical protein
MAIAATMKPAMRHFRITIAPSAVRATSAGMASTSPMPDSQNETSFHVAVRRAASQTLTCSSACPMPWSGST